MCSNLSDTLKRGNAPCAVAAPAVHAVYRRPRATAQVTAQAAINGVLIGHLQTLLAHSSDGGFRAHVSDKPLLGHHETLLVQKASISVQFPSARL